MSEDRVENDRFKRFDLDYLSSTNENLDIHWLTDEQESDEYEGLRPDEISALVLVSLGSLIKDVEDLHVALNVTEDDQ
ncbi:hypothetical protein MF410_13635 [Rhizobium sp. C104]|uniref:hypothetical protein n=1 Tax=Rhizobium sp. C104 TaxID=2917727 RepID=UPI001EF7A986|nr:hypothetical protein [Rhizobium sp. C104]ULJ77113.1 hypothetical protein MF410_13635 [Rhizobium sp. C104]